jgi:hypothetical protein
MKVLGGLVLLALLVVIIQLGDATDESPVAEFRALPVENLVGAAQVEARNGRPDRAVLLLDYMADRQLPDPSGIALLRQEYFDQIAARTTSAGRLMALGWTASPTGVNAYTSLAGGTIADAVMRGAAAGPGDAASADGPSAELHAALNQVKPIAAVFPPSVHAIALVRAAHVTGAINNLLSAQLLSVLTTVAAAPQSAAGVENFREHVMPILELARQCRTWTEFHIILLQADSADQVKVLTRMAATGPVAARDLARVLTLATRAAQPTPSQCLDHVLRHGPRGLEALHAAAVKGGAGLAFATAHPSLPATAYTALPPSSGSLLGPVEQTYRDLRHRFGAGVTLFKYWLIALLAALMILTFVPGVYLEKLVVVPGKQWRVREPGPAHHLMVALGVGVAVSALTYVFAMALSPATELLAQDAAAAGSGLASGAAPAQGRADSALLSGTVVALSLLAHVAIWFWVRSKLRSIEEDDKTEAALRLQRLENLDVFLDLPLFTGLALTVIAFILITFDAGMSRHFAYTSTVVGILSAVSLRVLFLFPLKERLVQARWRADS